jgi:UDP-N-acetylmuramoyl-tripeptide--D-alanyl-D-alanine ligase
MTVQLGRLESIVKKATHFSTDSREVGPGGVFIALKGDNRDGHDFVSEVLAKGALAAIVEKNVEAEYTKKKDERIYVVKDTREAHWKIAAIFRKNFRGPVIGIGGSSGKTSTKEIIYHVLSKKFKCIKTEKSQNGLLGIPRTLEKLREGVEIAIVEIGIDAPGDMERNVSLVRPTHAMLTSIGEEHLNLLKDLDGVFTEERILVDDTLARGGSAYCPSGDRYLSKLSPAKMIPANPSQLNTALNVNQSDKHVLQNMSLAAALALDLGMSASEINEELNSIQTLDGRGLKWQVTDELWVLRDHYNANPSSMEVALESARNFAKENRADLRLILGDMLDLGAGTEQYHSDLVGRARALGAKSILWVGPELGKAIATPARSEFFLANSTAAISNEIIAEFKKPGVVLVKGSRGTALEKTMDRLYGLFASRM